MSFLLERASSQERPCPIPHMSPCGLMHVSVHGPTATRLTGRWCIITLRDSWCQILPLSHDSALTQGCHREKAKPNLCASRGSHVGLGYVKSRTSSLKGITGCRLGVPCPSWRMGCTGKPQVSFQSEWGSVCPLSSLVAMGCWVNICVPYVCPRVWLMSDMVFSKHACPCV